MTITITIIIHVIMANNHYESMLGTNGLPKADWSVNSILWLENGRWPTIILYSVVCVCVYV